MTPEVFQRRLADVAASLYRTIQTLNLPLPDQLALEALWIRLDDLVEQLPERLSASHIIDDE